MDPAYPNAPLNSPVDPLAPAAAAVPAVASEERTWAMGAHLSALIGHVIPFGHILAPLVMLIWKKEQMPFVGDQAREALNFQISMTFMERSLSCSCSPLSASSCSRSSGWRMSS